MKYCFALALVSLVGCGDSSSSSEPLISGDVSGTFDTTTFAIKNGVLGKSQGVDVIALSSDAFNCDSLSAPEPPTGNYAAIVVSNIAVGVYNNVSVQMYENHGNFHGVGSNLASLGISLTSPEKIGANVAYSDTIEGKSYSLQGTFEVTRCP